MPVQFLSIPSGQVLFDSDQVSPSAVSSLWRKGLTNCSTPLPGCAGRDGVRVIRTDQASPWVWRHNRRGGWPGRLVRDSYVWLGAQRTRAFREWQLLRHLQKLGLPAPVPVAAFYERRGLVYRSDLITSLLIGTDSLGARLKQAPLPLPLWRSIGACIRRFHAHGIDHADLNVQNILLDREDQVYLIDFDRGEIRQPGAWIDANWARLRRSLDKLMRALPVDRFGPDQWTALRFG